MDPVARFARIPLFLSVAAATACGQLPNVHDNEALPVPVDATIGTELSAHGESSRTRGDSGKGSDKGAPRAPEVTDGTEILKLPPLPPDAKSITYTQWSGLFLKAIDAPVCRNNVIAVVAWEVQERTDAAWNPLATTYHMKGATRFNSVGVRNYVSLEQGIEATVRTLAKGLDVYGYGPVVKALRLCVPPMLTAKTINASRWCLGCTRGLYVTGLVRAVAEALAA